MSEREKADAQREEQERLATEEAEREAAEREAEEAKEREAEEEEAERHPEERKQMKGKKYAIRVSAAQRLGFALAYSKIPLLQNLAPHVVDFDWRPDGRFELTLAKDLTFEVGDSTLSFNDYVTGIAEPDGLTELDGVMTGNGETDNRVLGISGDLQGAPVINLNVEGMRKPMKVPTPDVNQTG
ncbi:MAG: hypothetical protein H6705_17540 [Myxococcales bacterium]|nr:hypothetical protein [Myxococcales bacterium]